MRTLIRLLIALLFVPGLHAEIYRCQKDNGTVTYQDRACNEGKAVTLDSHKKTGAKRFFWKAEGQDKILFLLGSIHFGKPDLYPLPAPIMKAFQSSDALVVEADIRGLASNAPLSLAKPKTSPFNHVVPPTSLPSGFEKAIQEFADRAGLPYDVIKQQNPWLLSLALTQSFLQKAGYSPELGIDRFFLQQADRAQKPVIPLETLESQQALLETMSALPPEALWRQLLDQFQDGGDFQQLMQTWQRGDAETLDQLTRKAFADPVTQPLYEAVFTHRNHNMTDKLVQLENHKKYFVVVGAGHMVGPEGIVKLLQEAGFRVSQPSF